MDKTPAELAREQIEVVTSAVSGEEVEIKTDETKTEEVETKTEETTETTIEKTEEKVEEIEEEVEDLEKQKLEAKTQKERDRFQKRIDKLTGETKSLREENELLRKQLEGKKEEGEEYLTEEEVDKRAQAKAQAIVLQEEFTKTCNRLATEAEKIDKNFTSNVQNLAVEVGPIPSVMIGILADLDNGATVLAHLAKNLDEAEDMYKLNPAKMGVELTKLSGRLVPKKEPKAHSKVPDPINPLGSNGRTPTILNDKMTDAQWIEARNKQRRDAGKPY